MLQRGGWRGERVHVRLDRMRRKLGRSERLQPRVPVRREDCEWCAGLRENFASFEDDLVLVRMERAALRGQRTPDRGVTVDRRGFIVVIGEHGVSAELGGEQRNDVTCYRMPDEQGAPAGAQARIELGHAAVDEFDAAIGASRQAVQDFTVENEAQYTASESRKAAQSAAWSKSRRSRRNQTRDRAKRGMGVPAAVGRQFVVSSGVGVYNARA